MRILNSSEKEICRRILKGNGANNFLGNIVDSELQGICIYVDRKNIQSHLIFTVNDINNISSEEYEKLSEATGSITPYILEVVNLINQLEKEGYILLLERGINSMEPSKFGRCVSNLPSIEHHFVDKNFIQLLCDYSNKEIYTTEEFNRFCNNNFLARDEQRFRKQMRFTQIALGIAIAALLFNIIINFFVEKNDVVKIDKAQLESIIKTIKEL